MIYIMGMDIFGRKRIKHLEGVIESLESKIAAVQCHAVEIGDKLMERIDAAEKSAAISSIELDAREMIGKIQPQTTEDGLTNYRGMIREAWDLARAWDIERKRGA